MKKIALYWQILIAFILAVLFGIFLKELPDKIENKMVVELHESQKKVYLAYLAKVKEELADILSFAFLLAEKHGLDPFEIVAEKIKLNGEKYPVDKAKGTATKYTDL